MGALPIGGPNCICGGRSERFPDAERPCVCYSDRNPACRCYVNPGGQDGVMIAHDCRVHSRRSPSAGEAGKEEGR